MRSEPTAAGWGRRRARVRAVTRVRAWRPPPEEGDAVIMMVSGHFLGNDDDKNIKQGIRNNTMVRYLTKRKCFFFVGISTIFQVKIKKEIVQGCTHFR
jgi:hypothetical protein